MNQPLREIVIPKEKAVFRMDGNGHWFNRHGRFEHKKIIDYFNRSIQKDDNGYYVCQIRGDIREKVYFFYEDTPVFAVKVIMGDTTTLLLNTGGKIKLDPNHLYIKNDRLFQKDEDMLIKFTEQAMMAMANLMEERKNRVFIKLNNNDYEIPEY